MGEVLVSLSEVAVVCLRFDIADIGSVNDAHIGVTSQALLYPPVLGGGI